MVTITKVFTKVHKEKTSIHGKQFKTEQKKVWHLLMYNESEIILLSQNN